MTKLMAETRKTHANGERRWNKRKGNIKYDRDEVIW